MSLRTAAESGERSLCEKLWPWGGVHSGDEAILAKRFLVKKRGGAQFRIEVLVVGFVERFRLDADLVKQGFGDIAILVGTFDGLRSTVAQQHPPAGAKFVAFGMAAEIVMIVQDENARTFPCASAKEISGRETAEAAADNDEVIVLAGGGRIAERIRAFAVAQTVGEGEGAIVISAHAQLRGRIVVR